VNDRDAILAYARTLRPDDAVLVPARLVIAFLEGSREAEAPSASPGADFTIRQIAERFGRQPSTVRGWVESGRLRGYRFAGREWRVSQEALREFEAGERQRGTGRAGPKPGRSHPVDLSAWRRSAS
jgi:excisionase family DNA binding protein